MFFYYAAPSVVAYTEDRGLVPEGVEALEAELPESPGPGYRLQIRDGAVVWEAMETPVRVLTPEEDRDAMLVDLEYRLTLLELGV